MEKSKEHKSLFIGVDLGGKEKKTTGLCILEEKEGSIVPLKEWCENCEAVKGKELLSKIKDYLKNARVIAIDAPLTEGQGKGDFRLYEKFLSTQTFRKAKASPLPPALMEKFCSFAREIAAKLEEKGFVLNINLIEVFPTLTKRLSGKNILSVLSQKPVNLPCQKEDQKSALTCAILAYLHSQFKTRYLGYRDGFLFLPEMSLWKEDWKERFYKAWKEKPYLRYRYLVTNLFDKNNE